MMQRSTVIAAGLCTIGSGLAQEIAVSIGCLYNPSLTQFISDRCDAAVYGVACTVLNDASPHVDKAFNDGQNAANGALLRQLEQLQVCIQGLTHQVTTVEAESVDAWSTRGRHAWQRRRPKESISPRLSKAGPYANCERAFMFGPKPECLKRLFGSKWGGSYPFGCSVLTRPCFSRPR